MKTTAPDKSPDALRRGPDFFLVGAAKSGTSSLANYLAQHPSVFMTEPKEPHFFGELARPPVREVKGMSEYLGLFRGAPEGAKAGEASTSYLYSPEAAREIQAFRPDAKILVILRDPVDRAYSQYWNQVREGVEPLGFEEALRAEPERIARGWRYGFHYVEAGRYAGQVARYLELFGPQNVNVHLFEDLKEDADGVSRDVFSFLGVDPSAEIRADKAHNPSGSPKSPVAALGVNGAILLFRVLGRQWRKRGLSGSPRLVEKLKGAKDWMLEKNSAPVPTMDPATRAKLKETFAEDVLSLQDLIGRDLTRWL